MKRYRLHICIVFFCLAVGLFFLFAVGKPFGDEPEERRALIVFLNDTVLPGKGAFLPELAGKEKKAVGRYAEHYELLQSFQKKLAGETEKNTGELLALAEFEDLAMLAQAEKSLKKAVKEAEKIRTLVDSLLLETDGKKEKLFLPDDLAPAYNAAYDKVVSRPGAATSVMFGSVYATFSAILDMLDFVDSHSREMEIDGKNINLKNIALKDELQAKITAIRERSLDLSNAYAEMIRTMSQ